MISLHSRVEKNRNPQVAEEETICISLRNVTVPTSQSIITERLTMVIFLKASNKVYDIRNKQLNYSCFLNVTYKLLATEQRLSFAHALPLIRGLLRCSVTRDLFFVFGMQE
jgi:hypothetical protein